MAGLAPSLGCLRRLGKVPRPRTGSSDALGRPRLGAELGAFLSGRHQSASTTVAVHGVELGVWRFAPSNNPDHRHAIVPRDPLGRIGVMLAEFKMANPESPLQLRVSGDGRKLGLGSLSLAVTAAGKP